MRFFGNPINAHRLLELHAPEEDHLDLGNFLHLIVSYMHIEDEVEENIKKVILEPE